MQCKEWTKKERNIKGKRKKQRGREKEPQRDKESSRQENPDWGSGRCKTRSQVKKIPGTRCKLGNPRPCEPRSGDVTEEAREDPAGSLMLSGAQKLSDFGGWPSYQLKARAGMVGARVPSGLHRLPKEAILRSTPRPQQWLRIQGGGPYSILLRGHFPPGSQGACTQREGAGLPVVFSGLQPSSRESEL